MKDLENLYVQLAQVLVGLAGSDWVTASVSAPVLGDRCGGIELSSITIAGKKKWLKPTSQAITAIDEIFLRIRDELRADGGTRIWSICFDLQKDGKMSAKFGYDKPSWYDERDDAAEILQSAEMFDMPAVDLFDLGEIEADALKWLQGVTAENTEKWGIGSEARWDLDMSLGEIRWIFPGERTLIGTVQVLGTHRTDSHDFRWSWDNPSIPGRLSMVALKLRNLGERHGISELSSSPVIVNDLRVWSWAGIAVKENELEGAYRVNSNGTWIYLLYSNVRRDVESFESGE